MSMLKTISVGKHTTIAAILYAMCELLIIWMPDHAVQLEMSKNWVIVYGLLFAGDAKPQKETYEPPRRSP